MKKTLAIIDGIRFLLNELRPAEDNWPFKSYSKKRFEECVKADFPPQDRSIASLAKEIWTLMEDDKSLTTEILALVNTNDPGTHVAATERAFSAYLRQRANTDRRSDKNVDSYDEEPEEKTTEAASQDAGIYAILLSWARIEIQKASQANSQPLSRFLLEEIAKGFVYGPEKDLLEVIPRGFYPQTSENRKHFAMDLTHHAKRFVYTVSDWAHDHWNDDVNYRQSYINLAREGVEVRRMFVHDSKNGVAELCKSLNEISNIFALDIPVKRLNEHQLKELKSLWLMDGIIGTKSNHQDPMNGHVIWGREVANEMSFFRRLWDEYAHLTKPCPPWPQASRSF